MKSIVVWFAFILCVPCSALVAGLGYGIFILDLSKAKGKTAHL